jgi:flagellar P-ring protein precursor FlgI
MDMRSKVLLSAVVLTALSLHLGLAPAGAAPRIKDISKVGAGGETRLIGYGLVVGLDGTGDSKGTEFTVQSVTNMLTRMGITVPQNKVKTKNVAAVIVSAEMPFTARAGTRIDVTVSSLGDAKSLEGGTLLLSPLKGTDGAIYARAQGPVSVGGFKAAGAGGDQVSKNYTLVGRIPSGAVVEAEAPAAEAPGDYVDITLFHPDYTTAARISRAITDAYGNASAVAIDPALVRVTLPEEVRTGGSVVDFIAEVETTRVNPDVAAIVVINEKTGTIVAGDNVTIGAVAIAHGGLSIEIRSWPVISQPAPFSARGTGRTVVAEDSDVQAEVEQSSLVAFNESASVAEVARALNALGVTPRDIIAIFQALKEAGALRAQIKII